jgi:uncharacterized protein
VRLKSSRYNIAVGDHGLFNTATGNYVVLDGALAATWARLRDGAMVEPEEAGLLFRAGFAVEDHLDELAAVEIAFSAGRTAKTTPHFTIAPTLDCNYACDYCFEEHVRGTMSPEMQIATVELVRSAFADGPGELSVTWFGGEPLMALSVVKGLSRRFLDLVGEGVLASYHADLVTNGQLLRPGVPFYNPDPVVKSEAAIPSNYVEGILGLHYDLGTWSALKLELSDRRFQIELTWSFGR